MAEYESKSPVFDPFELEESFQGLRVRLAHPSSPGRQIREIDAFMARFLDSETSRRNIAPYLLELGSVISRISRTFDPAGTDPQFLSAVISRLKHARSLIEDDYNVSSFIAAESRLSACVSCLEALLGDFEPVRIESEASAAISRELSQTDCLSVLSTRIKDGDKETVSTVDRITNAWKNNAQLSISSGHFITVDDTFRPEFGVLRSMSLEFLDVSAEDSFHVNAPSTVLREDIRNVGVAFAAARQFLQEISPSAATVHFKGRIQLEGESLIHSGSSGDLLIACLFVCSALEFTNQRRSFRVAGGVLMTGELKEDGRVVPVSANTLTEKVRSAYFSWAKILVVPFSQIQDARAVTESLKLLHPHRDLQVLGVENLRDVFSDRRLAVEHNYGRLAHLGQRIKRHRTEVFSTSAIIVLLTVIAVLIFGRQDRNPSYAAHVDAGINVYNGAGEILERIEVSTFTFRAMESRSPAIYLLLDIDGDGQKELIWGDVGNHRTGTAGAIRAKNVNEDTLRWEIPLTFPIDYAYDSGIVHSRFSPSHILADDFDSDGEQEIIANLYHQEYYPDIVLRIDPENGNIEGRYDHSGVFTDVVIADINADNVKDLIFTGSNNAYRRANLVVLDPRYLSGQGPTEGKYRIAGASPGSQLIYTLFPFSPIGEIAPLPVTSGNQIRLQIEDRTISVSINDSITKDAEGSNKVTGYHTVFNFELTPIAIATTSLFDIQYQRYLDLGLVSGPFDEEIKQKMLASFQFWDGTSFVSTEKYQFAREFISDSE